MPDANGQMTLNDLLAQSSGLPSYNYYDPSAIDYGNAANQNNLRNAQAGYYGSQGNYYNAQAANIPFQNALSTAQLSGYFGPSVGYGTVGGQATFPNLQYTTGAFGQYYPGGLSGVSPGTPTMEAQQNMQNYGLNQAGVTGVYYDPSQMTYAPGTFIRDPSTNAIGQIQSNGQMRMFGDQGDFLRAGGNWDMVNNPDMMRNVDTATYQRLAQPGQNGNGGTASLQTQQLYGTNAVPGQNAATMAMQAMYGGYGMPTEGQQTLGAQQQYWQQGFSQSQADIAQQNWQKAFQAQQGQNVQQNTLAYLQQLASLRGPADWAKYQQVLGSTPQGMRDLYSAAMGQYIPGGGATSGVAPQAADLSTMQQQMAGGQGYAQQQGGYYPPNNQQNQMLASGNQQYQNQMLASGGYRNAALPNGGNTGMSGDQMSAQSVQATGNGTNMYGGPQQQYNLPAPNQISNQAWNNMAPSQQQMLFGMYEANGWDKGDVEALRQQSLPKYGTNNATAGTWRLQ
jgi:hypothetical protein